MAVYGRGFPSENGVLHDNLMSVIVKKSYLTACKSDALVQNEQEERFFHDNIMIVSFSVSNFRSFSVEQTLSLVASNRLGEHPPNHTVPIPGSDERLLRIAVIYGANGAGKSNLFKALRYLQSIALNPRARSGGTGREPFRLGNGTDEPSSFDLQFIAENKLYRFGCTLDDHRIHDEWLVLVEGSREKALYERTTDATGQVTIYSAGHEGSGERLVALAKVGGPQNQTFLATIRANLEKADMGDHIGGVSDWFEKSLDLVAPDERLAFLGPLLFGDSGLLEFAGRFLKSSATGVDRLEEVRSEVPEDELRRFLSDRGAGEVLDHVAANRGAVLELPGGQEMLLERKDNGHFYRVAIQVTHKDRSGSPVPFDLAEESDGTRRLLHLIPYLYEPRAAGGVCFIDEIDRSLHPMLVRKILEFFLKSNADNRRQIIMTTHESNLLDQDLLRRDEIWFAEKDSESATRLYSLVDFKVRNDLEIRKHYLQGRFGAVPFLGDLDRLPKENLSPDEQVHA
jgi:hypothetical protein